MEKKINKRSISPIRWIPSAYFAMGMPFVVLNMVVVLMYKGMGVDNTQITLWTSLIMLPWTLKFLWSPLLEMYRTKKFFVVTTQIITGITFVLVALSLHLPPFFVISIILLAIIAFSGATHDIACDGVYMSELSKTDQAKYIGWQGAFYNIAKVVASGGFVYLAGYLINYFGGGEENAAPEVVRQANENAWTIVMLVCAAVMVALGIYHIFTLPSSQQEKSNSPLSEQLDELWHVIADFFTKKHIIYYIFFIILYRFAEGFVMKIVPLFLKASRAEGGLGLTEQQIGIYYGTFGAAAFVIGSILAGYYISHFGLKRTLFSLCCIFNIPFVVYVFLALYQPENTSLIATAIAFEYFGYGFGFVGLTLFMMQQIAPGKHQMAHYAFASGIMNLGVMIPGSISGWISDMIGYHDFFIMVMIATIPSFLITYFVPFTYDDSKKQTEK